MATTAYDIIKRPIITEQSMADAEMKRYTFEVAKTANKIEIAKAVEEIFGVKVAKVNTLNMYGKEKRKRQQGKEGKLGVEGMRPEVLEQALRRAGATVLEEESAANPGAPITKADLYAAGLTGAPDSAARRKALLRRLDLPEHLAANALLSVLNALYTREEFLARTAEEKR